mmetsp:Transcript_9549/g.11782  ORF Transcript_9549/g.11782 Transcript_9549/m.11782 type:complete len:125 (-) Transcript_9549:221-595(-)
MIILVHFCRRPIKTYPLHASCLAYCMHKGRVHETNAFFGVFTFLLISQVVSAMRYMPTQPLSHSIPLSAMLLSTDILCHAMMESPFPTTFLPALLLQRLTLAGIATNILHGVVYVQRRKKQVGE